MKPPSAAGELFIHSGKFGEVRMKPKNCGNKSFIHLARKYRFRMKPQTAAAEIFIYLGLFGEVRMKPKACGNKSFIHLARKYRLRMKLNTAAHYFFIHLTRYYAIRMKPQTAAAEIFIYLGKFGEVRLAIGIPPCYVLQIRRLSAFSILIFLHLLFNYYASCQTYIFIKHIWRTHMHKISAELLTRKHHLEGIIKNLTKKLEKAPSGGLKCCRHGNSFFYYHTVPGKNNHSYIRSKDRKKAAALAQKEYYLKALRLAENELAQINYKCKSYPGKTYEEAILEMSQGKRLLVNPIWLPDKEFFEQWQAQTYVGKGFTENDKDGFYTEKGERVRSKSEALIANTLSRFHVPYLYEYPLKINELGLIHPDFRVINIRTRHEFFWEHNGKMNDTTYGNGFANRYQKMIQNNFYPGYNLIMTFESGDYPLSQLVIDKTVKEYLL